LDAIKRARLGQVIIATHAPMLMVILRRPLRLSKDGLHEICVKETEHVHLMREFWADPDGFVKEALADVDREQAEFEDEM
jgi:predicted ATPase